MLMDFLRIYVSFIKCLFISFLAEVASKTEIKTALRLRPHLLNQAGLDRLGGGGGGGVGDGGSV